MINNNKKWCYSCSRLLEIDSFCKREASSDGLSAACKECNKKYKAEYYKKNKKVIKKWIENNRDLICAQKRRWYAKNKNGSVKQYKLKNQNKIKQYRKEHGPKYQRDRFRKDIKYRIRMNVGCLIRARLRARLSNKGKSTISEYLPYTIEQLKQHLESLFKPGMGWNNYGKWHVDHIIPDCSFKYKSVDDEEFKQCWALSNLQPLWAIENIKKGGKILDN